MVKLSYVAKSRSSGAEMSSEKEAKESIAGNCITHHISSLLTAQQTKESKRQGVEARKRIDLGVGRLMAG